MLLIATNICLCSNPVKGLQKGSCHVFAEVIEKFLRIFLFLMKKLLSCVFGKVYETYEVISVGSNGPIYLKAASRNGTRHFKQASTKSYFFFQRKLSQSFR